MPFPVQSGRFAAMVRRLFNLQGHVGLQAIDDVFLVQAITQPDDETLVAERGEVRFAEGVTAAALAGNFSFAHITNPEGSGRLVVVEEAWVHGTVPTGFEFVATITRFTGGGAALRSVLDPRVAADPGLNQTPQFLGAFIGTGTSGAPLIGNSMLFGQIGTNVSHVVFRPGAVLPPGYRFAVFCQTVNTELHATFIARSRDVTPQELALG